MRAFPNEHRYRLDGRTFGELFEMLIEKRIPLMVKANAIDLGDLLTEFPKLIVIGMNQGPHPLDRFLFPILDAHPNFYIETSYYGIAGMLEAFCARFGPKRLLFGSGFPDNCSGGALLNLVQAEIDVDMKNAIAFGNLENLISGVKL